MSEVAARDAATLPGCRKGPGHCVCVGVSPRTTKHRLLILQHPQEQDAALGTACIARAVFAGAQFKIGLSWPNLARALGEPADPKRWGVLYLGARGEASLPGPLAAVDRHGAPLSDQEAVLRGLEGVVVLDGSWAQVKALWWRNAWLLKLRRLVLAPVTPSRYGRLRREPRKESVSTLEAAALTLAALERDPALFDAAMVPFQRLLDQHRRPG